MTDLMRPLFAQFAGQYTNSAHRFIAEGDWVVVECRGKVNTKAGQALQRTSTAGSAAWKAGSSRK